MERRRARSSTSRCEPDTGEGAWLEAVRSLLPEIAAAFGPDLVVSQHGADSHAWDPLAHLRNTTTAMAEAARLVDAVAHREAGGRWLSTGGGGYGVYDVVPRSWSLVWLAAAHREAPDRIPEAWRERWAGEAARYGTATLPATFIDPPNAGDPASRSQDAAERQSRATADAVRSLVVPRLVRAAVDRGWWDPRTAPARPDATASPDPAADPTIVAVVDPATWDRLRLADRVIPPARTTDAHALIAAALRSGASVSAAIAGGDTVVAVAVTAPDDGADPGSDGDELLALGVAPAWRRRGLAGRLLEAHAAARPARRPLRATIGVAERDVVEPLDRALRIDVARRILTGAGFEIAAAPDPIRRLDPPAVSAVRR